jgi:hypothetical protein
MTRVAQGLLLGFCLGLVRCGGGSTRRFRTKNAGRHKGPRHWRGADRPERTRRHPCSRLMIRALQKSD